MTNEAEGAYVRFLASMDTDYEAWHDGTSYDLDALDVMTADRRGVVEAMLVTRSQRQWRDIEALAHLGTPAALAAIRADLASEDLNTRLYAARTLIAAGQPVDIGPHIVAALEQEETFGGLDQVLDLAAAYPTDAVKAALLRGARGAADDRGVHYAALLYHICGKAEEAFDWDLRPFFLRFRPEDPEDRARAFAEMCAELGLAPETIETRKP